MGSLLSGEGPTIMTSFNPTYLLHPPLSPIKFQSIMMYLLIVLLAHILCSEIIIFPYMYMMYFDHIHSHSPTPANPFLFSTNPHFCFCVHVCMCACVLVCVCKSVLEKIIFPI